MKRPECQAAIRRLTRDWAAGQDRPVGWNPSFVEFVDWLKETGNSQFLEFRSTMGARNDAEQWFDQELGQTWRN